MVRTALAVLIGALAAGATAHAHHSFAADYVEDQSVTYEGEVREFQYRNPHAWVIFDARDERGNVRTYSAEWGGTNRLTNWGISPTSIKPGDRVIVTGAPGRTVSERKLHLKRIQRPADGWGWPAGR